MTLSREELVKFMDTGKVTNATVRVIPDQEESETPIVKKEPRAARAAPNGSGRLSVNAAILQRLDNGPASVGDLKEALLSAGKSAASLSTGIAALTKSGKIERSNDGEYAKAA